jgi:hypothetical protein
MIRNRKPSVSARPAKVSAGLAKLTIADTVNSPPNNAQAQRAGMSSVESAKFSTPRARNMSPTRMPTVVTDAWSN